MIIQSFWFGRIPHSTTSAFTSANMNGASYWTLPISPFLMALTGAGPQRYWPEIRVITKLPNSKQSYKGKVKTHKYINRQNQSTTGKLWKPQWPWLGTIIYTSSTRFKWQIRILYYIIIYKNWLSVCKHRFVWCVSVANLLNGMPWNFACLRSVSCAQCFLFSLDFQFFIFPLRISLSFIK